MPVHAPRTWFDAPDHEGVAVAVITDDLRVEVNALGTVTICGWDGSDLQLDFDDIMDIADVLLEAIQILRGRGRRPSYPLRESTSCGTPPVTRGALGSSCAEGDDAGGGDTSDG